MELVAIVAVTAIVAGSVAALVARRFTTLSIAQAMGLDPGADPGAEHRRVMQEALQQQAVTQTHSDLLQLSLDALMSGVIVTDLSGKVLAQNNLATAIAPRAHEQALLRSAATELLALAAQGEPAERELAIFGPPPRTLFIHAAPVNKDDVPIGALAVIDDVSEHYRVEKTRRDFVANLSHELRTPVGAASLLGEMLVDEDEAHVRQQLTNRLIIETDRMTATIDDLLELSRIESTEQTYDHVVDLQPLFDEALARTRVAAETKHVTVASILPSDPIVMAGNRDQLLTAVVNLVENAIKYSSAGDLVSVRARADDDIVYLVVQDTGRGIPSRDVDRIFERFYRVDKSRGSETGGTGIGLSIVRHVALNHGGTVAVTSYEGDGSTFTMELPLIVPAQPAEISPNLEVT